MQSQRTLHPVQESQIGAVARMICGAFGGTLEDCEKWARRAGIQNLRILTEDSPASERACLLRVPMGQYFGGRGLGMTGIAGVSVAPEDRGRGYALDMMRAAMREIVADGTPLSGLYASTQELYRQVGFEQGGHCFRIKLPLASLKVKDRDLPVRVVGAADEAAIRACYHRFACRFDGMLDRGEYVWGRIRKWREFDYQGWCVPSAGADSGAGSGGIEGYIFLRQERKDTGRLDLQISDVAFTTARAGRRLLGFLADFATITDDATISQAGPVHPLLTLLPTQKYSVERREYWMTRITSLKGALEGRGYPAGLSASVVLEVKDNLIDANTGFFTLAVEGGRASLRPGGSGPRLKTCIGGLVPLFTGLYSAEQALLSDLVECDAGALAAANAIFAGGSPWMADFF